jgi:hypothetical protein
MTSDSVLSCEFTVAEPPFSVQLCGSMTSVSRLVSDWKSALLPGPPSDG